MPPVINRRHWDELVYVHEVDALLVPWPESNQHSLWNSFLCRARLPSLSFPRHGRLIVGLSEHWPGLFGATEHAASALRGSTCYRS